MGLLTDQRDLGTFGHRDFPVRPATSSTQSVLRAAAAAEMLPKTVVMAHISTAGSASR